MFLCQPPLRLAIPPLGVAIRLVSAASSRGSAFCCSIRQDSICSFPALQPRCRSQHDCSSSSSSSSSSSLSSVSYRFYEYTIDVHGQLFLSSTPSSRRTIATALREPKFLDFFYQQIQSTRKFLYDKFTARKRRKRNSSRNENQNENENENDEMKITDEEIAQYYGIPLSFLSTHPFISPCGSELNFIQAEVTPIVFHHLTQIDQTENSLHSNSDSSASSFSPPSSNAFSVPRYFLSYAGSLSLPFDPSSLRVDDSGRFYHFLPSFLSDHLRISAQSESEREIESDDRIRSVSPNCIAVPRDQTQQTQLSIASKFGLIRSSLAVQLERHIRAVESNSVIREGKKEERDNTRKQADFLFDWHGHTYTIDSL